MNAKEQMLKSRRVKEQFERHHEAMKHENKKSKTYPDYEKFGAKKVKMPDPTHVEFGKVFDVSTLNLITSDVAFKAAYDMVLTDYLKYRAENFPTWEGLPEIKVLHPSDVLNRIYQIAWYVNVPKQFVINPDDKLEEDLWNS